MLQLIKKRFLTPAMLASLALAGWTQPAMAAETDVLAAVLKKIDGVICSAPNKVAGFYTAKPVIMIDDHRTLLESRIKSYQGMIAEFQEMKCDAKRTVLNGQVGKDFGFLLVDEQISITSRMSTNDRQHGVCTYVFRKEGNDWKIQQEHCSSLPDYTINPGEDALYYYHNPVY